MAGSNRPNCPAEALAVEAVRRADKSAKLKGVRLALDAVNRAIDCAERDHKVDLTLAKRAVASINDKETAWPGQVGLP